MVFVNAGSSQTLQDSSRLLWTLELRTHVRRCSRASSGSTCGISSRSCCGSAFDVGRVDRVALLRQTLSLVEIAFGVRETGSRPHMIEDLIGGCSQESDALAKDHRKIRDLAKSEKSLELE